jgi:lysophospholipase L1-like esterase
VLHPVQAVVYYDVNQNGVLDPEDTVRLSDAEVRIGGGTGQTQVGTGRAVVQAPEGTHEVVVQPSSMPPFFVQAVPVTISVPRAEEILVPVTLPIGQNRPFNYLATGDSITKGVPGSSDEMGYRSILLTRLREYYQVPVRMFYRGRGGGPSSDGVGRTPRDLTLIQPAYVLIGWGTNDWNECGEPSTCPTIPNLRTIVRDVKAANSLPCVATLVPPNVGNDARAPESRAEWVREMNEMIRDMALEEDALLVDIHGAFMAAGGPSGLIVDHVHPNDRGFEVMAEAWFNALTRPRSFSAAGM